MNQREIFLSRKESFPLESSLNMNGNEIENLPAPVSERQAANKSYH